MSIWVRRSIEIAESDGYLDGLSEIYPAERLPERPLKKELVERIKELYEANKGEELVILLLNLTRKNKNPFPIEHPYASLLRQKIKLVPKNPKIVRKLGEILLSMNVDDIIRGCQRPPDINRVMGLAFQNWLKRKFSGYYPFIDGYRLKDFKDPAFLDGRNTTILNFIKNVLNIDLKMGKDFLFKVGNIYVIGEARFLSTYGGSQTRDLNEVISFIKSIKSRFLIPIGVLDGIVWYNKKYKNMLFNLNNNEHALTALLLEDFLENLIRNFS